VRLQSAQFGAAELQRSLAPYPNNMKILLIVIMTIFLSTTLCMAECLSEQINLSAKICFERFESNGSINIHETVLKLSNYQTVSLIGGQAACVFVEPGEYFFNIETCKPYETSCKTWSSEKYSFKLRTDETISFEIYPTGTGAAYTGFFAAKRITRK
jgi:hypothetical protein